MKRLIDALGLLTLVLFCAWHADFPGARWWFWLVPIPAYMAGVWLFYALRTALYAFRVQCSTCKHWPRSHLTGSDAVEYCIVNGCACGHYAPRWGEL